MPKPYPNTQTDTRAVILERIDRLEVVRLPIKLLRNPNVKAPALKTWCMLYALSGYEGGLRTTFRNKRSIAEALGLSFSTFKAHLAVLRKERWIHDEPLEPHNPASATKVYVLQEQAPANRQGQLFGQTGPENRPSAGPENRTEGEETFEGFPKGTGRGRKSAGPGPFDRLFSDYPGRKKARAAKAKFFQLLRETSLKAPEVEQRVSDLVRFYDQLGWPLPQLANVLDFKQEVLTDANLGGLEADAMRKGGKPKTAGGTTAEAQQSRDLDRLREHAESFRKIVAEDPTNERAKKQLAYYEAKIKPHLEDS